MRQRQPRLHDDGYLEFLRLKPCCVCGSRIRVEAAHLRHGLTGMGRKPDDRLAVPLCAWCHREGPNAQHKMNEMVFWSLAMIDPFSIASFLYKEYGGTGGKAKGPRKIKVRKPKASRAPFASGRRPWPKIRLGGSQWSSPQSSGDADESAVHLSCDPPQATSTPARGSSGRRRGGVAPRPFPAQARSSENGTSYEPRTIPSRPFQKSQRKLRSHKRPREDIQQGG